MEVEVDAMIEWVEEEKRREVSLRMYIYTHFCVRRHIVGETNTHTYSFWILCVLFRSAFDWKAMLFGVGRGDMLLRIARERNGIRHWSEKWRWKKIIFVWKKEVSFCIEGKATRRGAHTKGGGVKTTLRFPAPSSPFFPKSPRKRTDTFKKKVVVGFT